MRKRHPNVRLTNSALAARDRGRKLARLPRHVAQLTPEDAQAWVRHHPMCWQRIRELARAEGIIDTRHVLALMRSTDHCPANNRQALELARLLTNMLGKTD